MSSVNIIPIVHGMFGSEQFSPFTFVVDTTKAGSASTHFILPLNASGTYDFDIEWGDGNTESL